MGVVCHVCLDTFISPGRPRMSPVQPAPASDPAPGGLLQELERRQDEALAQIDALDAKLMALLNDLGVTAAPDAEL